MAPPLTRISEGSLPASTTRSVYSRPDVYDMEYAESNHDDAWFLAELLRPHCPRHVVDLACGSGRVTFRLAEALHDAIVIGVDSSAQMLQTAMARHAAAGPGLRARVSFVEGDMRDWAGVTAPVDVVVIAGCSVSHLLTLDDRLRTWSNAFRLLRPGGLFVIDVQAPDLATLAEAQRAQPRAPLHLDRDATNLEAGREDRLLRYTAMTYEPHLQRANVRQVYDRFERRLFAERLVADFACHVYFTSELELLFAATGFEMVQQYGDYRFAGVTRMSSSVVCVARRPVDGRGCHERPGSTVCGHDARHGGSA